MNSENDKHRDDDIWNGAVPLFKFNDTDYTDVNLSNETEFEPPPQLNLIFTEQVCIDIDQAWRTAEVVVQTTLIPVIIVTNILVIAAPIYWRKLRTPDNILMVNLAVSDLLIGVVSMPLSLISWETDILGVLRRTKDGCVFLQMLQMLPTTLSILTLDMMNLERLLAIRFPLVHVQKVDVKRTFIAILCVWAYALTVYAVGLHEFQFEFTNIFENTTDADGKKCDCVGDKTIPEWWIYFMEGNVLASIVLCWISVFYLMRVIRKKYSSDRKTSNRQRTPEVKRKQFKINVFLLLAFTLLWLPMAILGTSIKVGVRVDMNLDQFKLYVIAWLPICINSMLNPLIYAYCRKRNKMAYTFLISNWPCRWGLLGIHCTTLEAQRFHRSCPTRTDNRYLHNIRRTNIVLGEASCEDDNDISELYLPLSSPCISLPSVNINSATSKMATDMMKPNKGNTEGQRRSTWATAELASIAITRLLQTTANTAPSLPLSRRTSWLGVTPGAKSGPRSRGAVSPAKTKSPNTVSDDTSFISSPTKSPQLTPLTTRKGSPSRGRSKHK